MTKDHMRPNEGEHLADIPGVTWKVQGYLQSFIERVFVQGTSHFLFDSGSVAVGVFVWSKDPENPEAHTFVRMFANLVWGLNDTPALHQYVAYHTNDFVFGHLALSKTDTGQVTVFLRHDLLGDYLDQDELKAAVVGLVTAADTLGDELVAMFGGSKFAVREGQRPFFLSE